MAFNFTSYGDYFRSSQNPVCRIYGPTGATGPGATGATGPAGPAGNNGISTGLIYYFHAESPGGQPARGDTGFVMNTNIRPGPVGGNPDYLPTVYNGYFSNTQPTAGTSGPALLGEFQTSTGDPGVTLIPAGTWTFLMNIYTGIDYTDPGVTGITGAANTSISVYGEVWKISQGISTKIGNNQARPVIVNSATDDQLYTMGINIESPGQTLFTPLVDSMFVRIYAVPTTSTFVANQRIEFWTDGDSVSQVTTTLPAKSGNSGPTGPVGPTGDDGLPGKDGEDGSQGIQGPMGESTWTPVAVPPTNVRIGPTSGTFTKINGLVAGYDTAIRSAQSYPGCYVSFNSPSDTSGNTPGGGVTGTEATFGISSIPNPLGNTGVAVTDIQYGINYNASGTTYGWYESGTSVTVPGGCAPGDSFSIIYDGTNVNYYHQNSLVRSVARAAGQTGAFHLEGNFLNYGTINNLVFGPLVSTSGQGGWTPVLADSTRILQSVATSGVFTKIDASGDWNAGVRSAQAYSSGAYVSFNTPSTPSDVIIGLSDSSPINTTPPPNTYGAITYGINYSSSNTWFYIENGAVLGGANLCVAGDSFSIIYDGVNVKYYQNGVLKRTVPRAIGLPLHLESNFIYIGGTTSNLVFGPAGQSSQIAGYTYYPYNSGGTYTPITIPANVMSLDAILIGGGGGGGGGGGANSCGGGGGGAGFFEFLNLNPGVFGVTVLSGQTITYAVGAGGIGNSDEGGNGLRGQDGGSTWMTINGITYEAPGGEGAGPGNGGGGGGGGGNGGSGGGGGGGSISGGIGGSGQMTIYNGYNGTTTDIKGGIGGRSPFGTNFFTLPRPVKNPAVNGGCGGGWLGGWSNTTGAGGASSSKGYDGFGSGGGGRNANPGPGGISPEGNNGGNGGVYIRYIY